MKKMYVLLIGLAMAASVHAQLRSQIEQKPIDVLGGISNTGSLFGFFSPDRFVMNHSYSLSYFTGGGVSGSSGIYMNTMNFKLSNPLFLRVNMGVQHQPFGGPKIFGNEGANFLHGAELVYQPNKNLQMMVGYSNHPFGSGFGYYPNPFYQPRTGASPFQETGGRP